MFGYYGIMSKMYIINQSFLASVNKKQNVYTDNAATTRGQQKLPLASKGGRIVNFKHKLSCEKNNFLRKN
jgi:hypothetical protein